MRTQSKISQPLLLQTGPLLVWTAGVGAQAGDGAAPCGGAEHTTARFASPRDARLSMHVYAQPLLVLSTPALLPPDVLSDDKVVMSCQVPDHSGAGGWYSPSAAASQLYRFPQGSSCLEFCLSWSPSGHRTHRPEGRMMARNGYELLN